MTRMTYVNRKSEGVKLGQIVAKDLRKRLKLASKLESQRVAPQVQLELEGKELTDEGLRELVEGLQDATQPVDGIITTRLQSWNLSGNRLTAKALPYLAKALKVAQFDLEELNLSQNSIDIIEPSDLISWEDFVTHLGECKHLHRVILTDNAIGSGPAMEVFARVAIYSKLPEQHKDGRETTEQLQALQIRDPNRRLTTVTGSRKSHPVVTSQCLLSIPSWCLDNISLTDEGALFLSYVVVRHDWIHNGPLLTGGSHAKVKEDQGSFRCFPNESTTSIGARLLRLAQDIKEHELHVTSVNGEALLSTLLSRYEKTELVSTGGKPKHSLLHNPAQTSTPLQTPLRSSSNTQVYSSTVEELESLRKKVQRGIIENHGASSVSLWRAALTLLCHVRVVIIEPLIFPSTTIWKQNDSSQLPTNRYSEKVVNSIWPKLPSKASRAAYGRDEYFRSLERAVPLEEGNMLVRGSKFASNTSRRTQDSREVGLAENIANHQTSPSPHSPLKPKTLPVSVWECILFKVCDPQHLLSERQRRAIVEWGRSRSTLAAEMGSIGKLDSVQTWRVLDAMQCIFYDTRE